MDKLTALLKTRVDRFRQRVAQHILGETVPLQARMRHCPEPVSFAERLQGEYEPVSTGLTWGSKWESAWFHLTGQIPENWSGRKVVARLDVGGEGLIFSKNGLPLQGLSNGSVFKHDFNRDLFPISDGAEGGEKIEIWVEGASNGLFGLFTEPDPGVDHPNRFGSYNAKIEALELAVFHEDVWHLWLDLRILAGFLMRLPEKSVRFARILRRLNKAMDACVRLPQDTELLREMLAPELEKPAASSDLKVLAVGHAHIDTAWLWPVKETVRKCARTFASQIDLTRRYPGYVFGASQPQHFAFVKKHYPKLYQEIKRAVADGRIEPQGGMWVEADCNLISGESMVRQVLHGKNFFRDEFGVDVNHLWLPDVFGYSAAMPQILKKSGMRYFLTQKLSWSQFNDFPHTTFIWRGIDGSEVLTHFPPENTYNSQLDTEYLLPAVDNFREKAFMDRFISLFGVGDGGGGPKAENIEMGKRLANLESAPQVSFGPAASFFGELEQYYGDLPTWVGELYLELHRGTLTTHAPVKKANRKLEFKLRHIEIMHACLPLEDYPQTELDEIWKLLMLNQFHDILPGSSINPVYKVTAREYADLEDRCNNLLNEAGTVLFEEKEGAAVVCNTLSHEGRFVIELPTTFAGKQVAATGAQVLAQQAEENSSVVLLRMAGGSIATLTAQDADLRNANDTKGTVLENALVRYEFAADGTLLGGLHKNTGREIIAPGKAGNQITLYDDHPNDWDAWDVDIFYENHVVDRARSVSMEPLSSGPVRSGLRFYLKVGQSRITQDIWLSEGSSRLEFRTKVEWQEKHKMLRVAFPTTIRTEQASFDIQYGYVRRNTHRNTRWDMARFEVCGHKYADLSDHDFGVALLNDCKYGYKVHNATLDLNLLRSPNYPDPEADVGTHHFTYALFPHEGDLISGDVFKEATNLNQPPLLFNEKRTGRELFPWRLEGQGLSLEVVKKAEKENCHVLRIVETLGKRSNGKLHVKNARKVVATNLLEWEDGVSLPCDGTVSLNLKPFEILTFKVYQSN